MNKFRVINDHDNMRIDRWFRKNKFNFPQALIEKSLRVGDIKLNRKKVKSSKKIHTNDLIEIYNLDLSFKENKKKFIPSKKILNENEKSIIFDNDDFIVLNKSSGISVQGGTKSKKNLIDIFSQSKIFSNSKPFSVHRLDKDTSGIFIIAKNRETAQLFTSLFRLRKVHKTYLAICHGELLKNSGEWNFDLTRYENNKAIIEKAKTIYKVLDKNSLCSLVQMKPITGRKHQLRKQLYSIGHPIYGDQKYNLGYKFKGMNKNLMLHSYQLKFIIKDKKFTYTGLLPDYFKNLLKIKKLNFKFSN